MEARRDALRRLTLYLVLAFGLSAIFYVLIGRAGSTQAAGGIYTLGLMWCPGLAAILTNLVCQRSLKGMGWSLGPARYLLIAYLLPLGYGLVAYGTSWAVGFGALSTAGLPSQYPALGYLVVMATGGFLVSLLSATGEEIGWRGLLVPQLARLTSFTRVALISGAIWVVWHSPLIVFSDYTSDAPRGYALACFAVGVIGVSFVYAWLRLASGSLWTGAFLHASHNVFIQAVFDALTQNSGPTPYVLGEFGIALAVLLPIVGWFFWRRQASPAKSPGAVANAD